MLAPVHTPQRLWGRSLGRRKAQDYGDNGHPNTYLCPKMNPQVWKVPLGWLKGDRQQVWGTQQALSPLFWGSGP